MRRLAVTGAMLVLAATTGVAGAGIPTDQLRVATDRVLKIVQDPGLKKAGKAEERRKQIRAVANEIFDWQETGKRALARHWQARTPEQRAEFSTLFADLIERSYVGKIEAYSGEKILYVGEVPDGEQATVRTRLVTKSGTEIPIDYRMHKDGERWRAYDVLIENVSLVSNYRAQFNKVIQQSGYEDLVKRMKSKQEELVFEDAQKEKKKP